MSMTVRCQEQRIGFAFANLPSHPWRYCARVLSICSFIPNSSNSAMVSSMPPVDVVIPSSMIGFGSVRHTDPSAKKAPNIPSFFCLYRHSSHFYGPSVSFYYFIHRSGSLGVILVPMPLLLHMRHFVRFLISSLRLFFSERD